MKRNVVMISYNRKQILKATNKIHLAHVYGVLVVLSLIAVTWWSQTATAGASVHKRIDISMGKADTLNIPNGVVDILVASPGVIDVGILRSNRLFIVGRSVGDTNVLAFGKSGKLLADISVHVRIDQSTLQKTMKDFFPKEDVSIKTVNGDIVLSGSVSNPSVANQVRDLAGRFVTDDEQTIVDLMSVTGEQQVLLQMKIIEASRSVLREFGVETDYKFDAAGTDSSGLEFNAVGGVGLTSPDPFAAGSIFFDDNGGFGPLEFTLRALERDGLVNILAEPNLTAISGESAGFLAGGEFPVPVGTDRDGNIRLEYREFGVSLNFQPIVMSAERISLQLETEVSSLSDQNGLTLVGVDIPGLIVRRAKTTVELPSGGSLMIGGLISSNVADTMNGMPGITKVPVLGELFKSQSFQRDETEMIVLVTAVLVEPFQNAQAELESEKDEDKKLPPLTKALVSNLRKTFGNRLPDDLEDGPTFGYIVD